MLHGKGFEHGRQDLDMHERCDSAASGTKSKAPAQNRPHSHTPPSYKHCRELKGKHHGHTCLPRFPGLPIGPLCPGAPDCPFGPISPLVGEEGKKKNISRAYLPYMTQLVADVFVHAILADYVDTVFFSEIHGIF